eukprot:SAG22_NODE_6886_length_798_cov_1.972818_1_plen_185_part_01
MQPPQAPAGGSGAPGPQAYSEAAGSADIAGDGGTESELESDVELQALLPPEQADADGCAQVVKQKVRRKRDKMKHRISNTKAPMTILWGRDGWEKFIALVIFTAGLLFQAVGLFAQGWIKHCYSIAFVPDRFHRCPSYHIWQVCHAKGSRGCAGYYVAIPLFCCAVLCTFAMVNFLWAYLQGYVR